MSNKNVTENGSNKKEVLMAGLGGGGVLTVGETLLHAAASEYKYVSYFPSYGVSMRGGHVECTVILSNEKIGSPILPKANVVIIFNNTKLEEFEGRVRPGGLLILESTGLVAEPTRSDIKVLKVPAIETATALGENRASNQVLLGTYIKATGVTSPEVIEKQIEKRFKEKHLDKALPVNLEAFRRGLEMG